MSTKTSHRRHAICFKGTKRMTESHHKDKCDIHRIVKSAVRTGFFDHVSSVQADSSDAFTIPDFKTAMDKIAAAKSAFHELPSKIRFEFRNDPGLYVQFCSDPKNLPRLRELGLANPLVDPAPEVIQKVIVVDQKSGDSGKA